NLSFEFLVIKELIFNSKTQNSKFLTNSQLSTVNSQLSTKRAGTGAPPPLRFAPTCQLSTVNCQLFSSFLQAIVSILWQTLCMECPIESYLKYF
ncbi:MAG: hypothetical protein HC849_25385, partial [Oscillatoriales cyanobacterium RU_3_3]|nr:hypothetical protein [Oscillatoriales cyanobacterium RU_3_3]